MKNKDIPHEEGNLKTYGIVARYDVVSKIAREHHWRGVDFQKESEMSSFKRGNSRINIYLSQMTVVTIIDHPKKGRNILNRKHVNSTDVIEKIFIDPRVHTGIGYHARNELRIKMAKERIKKKQIKNV